MKCKNQKTMKKSLITSLVFLLMGASVAIGQIKQLPDITVYTLDGNAVSATSITNDSMPMLMCFWKTYENECCDQLIQLYNAWDQDLRPKGVKMVAICIDGCGDVQHVKPFVFGHNLDIEVYVDKNGDFKRAMGISEAPYNILFDQYMSVYCRHSGPCANADDLVCEKMNECLMVMNKDRCQTASKDH